MICSHDSHPCTATRVCNAVSSVGTQDTVATPSGLQRPAGASVSSKDVVARTVLNYFISLPTAGS